MDKEKLLEHISRAIDVKLKNNQEINSFCVSRNEIKIKFCDKGETKNGESKKETSGCRSDTMEW